MTRRRLVLLVAASVLVFVGLVAVVAVLVGTRTQYGRDRLLGWVKPVITRSVRGGTVYVGRVEQVTLDSLTVDSIAIRDKRTGELFLSTGRATFAWNVRDIIDNRLYVRHAHVEHPFLHLIERPGGRWNFEDIFPSSGGAPKPKAPRTRNFGDYIVVDSASARDVTFLLSMPWSPDDALRGAKRDSAIKFNLARTDHLIRKTADGYVKTYTWKNGRGLVTRARLADPDSDKFGRLITVARLDVDELDPPFIFRNARGVVRHLGDSVWFEAPHFDLPASTGVAHGKLVWGGGKPVRYDIVVRGDSVALNDVNWVYPTLPRSGGGTMLLTIKNDPANLDIVDFKLTKLDVRSTNSHLTGAMSFGVGAPVLLVRDVNLVADPVDFDLVRTLNGKPFPVDWRGRLVGTVQGRGGPLTHFVVDSAQGVWYDTHVRGASSRFAGRGELDIFEPALTAFHGFDVAVGSLDLRSIEYLFPSFPPLGGTASGTARLDSSWLDVRFSNAHITHQDGPGQPSVFTGSGRVTWGEPYMIYDMALEAQPLNLTMMQRSYPTLVFRGLVNGPIRAKGTVPNLDLSMSLSGAMGAFSFDGTADIDSVGGWAAHGRGQFSGFSPVVALARTDIPPTSLTGHYTVDVDSLWVPGRPAATTHGSLDVALERGVFDSVRVYPSRATVRFAGGKMIVDSARVRAEAGMVVATGALGLPGGRSDSLTVRATVDSLGGLRRYLGRVDSSLFRGAALPDSLTGTVSLDARLRGRVDSLDAAGTLAANDIYVRSDTIGGATLKFDIRDVVSSRTGTADLHVEKARAFGVVLDTLGGSLRMTGKTSGVFSVAGASKTFAATAGGLFAETNGANSVRLETFGLDIGASKWRLASPTTFTLDSTGTRLAQLSIRNADSGSVTVSGNLPEAGPVNAQLRATNVPLRDFTLLGQLHTPLEGVAAIQADVTGTRAKPELTLSAGLAHLRAGDDVKIERVAANANFSNGQLTARVDAFPAGKSAIVATANIPVDATLSSWRIRRTSPLTALLSADSADLGILGAFTSSVREGKGLLTTHVDVAGTWDKPQFSGDLNVVGGELTIIPIGVQATGINARMALRGRDSLIIESFTASSKGVKGSNSLQLVGSIAHLRDSTATFNLTLQADRFRAFDKRSFAQLDVSTRNRVTRSSTPITLTGTWIRPVLSGRLYVDAGAIFLPDREIARKRLVELEVDTTAAESNPVLVFNRFVDRLRLNNVGIDLGDDVWLRSREANIQLSGSLNVQRATPFLAGGARPANPFVLEGTLNADRGTYTLDLGLARSEFQVQPGGTVVFIGDNNPIVDITASHNVKQYGRKDLAVIVRVHGPLQPLPALEFSSNESYSISPSDLVSYLLIGEPGFDFTRNAGTAQRVAALIAPTVSSIAASTLSGLSERFGSLALIQFEGSSAGQNGTTTPFSQFLAGATVGGSKQLGSNTFVSFSSGLCQFFGGNSSTNPLSPDVLAGRVEYRFNPTLSLQGAREPATSQRYCLTIPGLINTPSQWSLSLSKTWRF